MDHTERAGDESEMGSRGSVFAVNRSGQALAEGPWNSPRGKPNQQADGKLGRPRNVLGLAQIRLECNLNTSIATSKTTRWKATPDKMSASNSMYFLEWENSSPCNILKLISST